ncbi:ABC transporter substrate-binding protein [Sarcina ventriculi]
MQKKIGLSVMLIMMVFVLSGCYSEETVSYKSEEKALVYSIEKIPETLINSEETVDRENDVICSLFEGLVEMNESGDVIPSLCQGWKVSNDGLEYIFKLREDIKWSNGEKITSFDFIDYFKYILSPDNENYKLDELYTIEGAKDYKNGVCDFESVKIQATDKKTIVITLNACDEEFLKKLSKPVYRLRDVSEPLNYYKDNYSKIRYTGAYIISNTSATDITLKRNDYYLDDAISMEEIKIKEQQSVEADFASYNLENIDIVSSPPVLSLDKGEMHTAVEYYPSNVIKVLVFNNENNITSDIRFRKGLFDGIFLEILDSYMIKYNLGMWAVNDIAYNDLLNKSLYLTKEYEVNEKPKLKENAKQLLNQLDTRKKVVSLVGKNISENKIISEFIKNTFQDEYDISVEITLLDDNELENYLKEKKFDIYIDDFDLDTYKLSNDYILEELNESLRDDYSIISLYYKNFLWCKSSKIDNLYIDANGNLILKYTKI